MKKLRQQKNFFFYAQWQYRNQLGPVVIVAIESRAKLKHPGELQKLGKVFWS